MTETPPNSPQPYQPQQEAATVSHQSAGAKSAPPPASSDRAWPYWPAVPLYPYGQRRTLRQEIVPGTLWTFEQLQGILYVIVPVRMTVVRLESGGLLVYAPVAPTPECVRLMQELVTDHGEVKYIILPTVSGIEHKIFVGPFARKFPNAQVYVAPDQWSFPLNLPLSWLGLPRSRTQRLPDSSADTPFGQEFDYAILGPVDLNIGPFEEVVFFHRTSKTLLVTDCIVSIPENPPKLLRDDPYPLLFHARESAAEQMVDTSDNQRKGWQRIVLFAFYFRPNALGDVDWNAVFKSRAQAPDRSRRAYFGLFPFFWKSSWKDSFETLRGNGQLLVAPVLQRLILNRSPRQVVDWANRVAQWPFEQIIPCHLEAPITTTPEDFRRAFGFLQNADSRSDGVLPETDFQLINQIDSALKGITPPPKTESIQS